MMELLHKKNLMPRRSNYLVFNTKRVGQNPNIPASICPSLGVGQGLGSEWYHNKKLKKSLSNGFIQKLINLES